MSLANVEYSVKTVSIDQLSKALLRVIQALNLSSGETLSIVGGVALSLLFKTPGQNRIDLRDVDLTVFRPPGDLHEDEKILWNNKFKTIAQHLNTGDFSLSKKKLKDGSLKVSFIIDGISFSIARRPQGYLKTVAAFNTQALWINLDTQLGLLGTLEKINDLGIAESINQNLIVDDFDFCFSGPQIIEETARSRSYTDVALMSGSLAVKTKSLFPQHSDRLNEDLRTFLKGWPGQKKIRKDYIPDQILRVLAVEDTSRLVDQLKTLQRVGTISVISEEMNNLLFNMNNASLEAIFEEPIESTEPRCIVQLIRLLDLITLEERYELYSRLIALDKVFEMELLSPQILREISSLDI